VPENLDPRAKDLISKLLTVDPVNRYGSGPPGDANDIEVLKKHEFFEGIDWANLHKTAPPIEKDKLNELKKITEPTARLSEFDDLETVEQPAANQIQFVQPMSEESKTD